MNISSERVLSYANIRLTYGREMFELGTEKKDNAIKKEALRVITAGLIQQNPPRKVGRSGVGIIKAGRYQTFGWK